MSKIAVMGDKDSVCGFAALGLEIYDVEEPEKAIQTLRQMANNDYAVIYITELLASQITDEVARYSDRAKPAIILIPGVKGNTGMGLKMVNKSVEKAVGSDILN